MSLLFDDNIDIAIQSTAGFITSCFLRSRSIESMGPVLDSLQKAFNKYDEQ